MSEEIPEEEKITPTARHWVQKRFDQVADELNKTQIKRIQGQTVNRERFEELHESLEEDGIHANKGLVKYSVRKSREEMIEDFNDDLFDFYDEFGDVVSNFAENLYEEVGDGQKTFDVLDRIARDIQTGNRVSFEYSKVKGINQFHEYLNRERQEISKVKAASPPSIEEIRENYYPEVPEKAYENFRELFDTEGPVDVTEQSEISDYIESKSDFFKGKYESIED